MMTKNKKYIDDGIKVKHEEIYMCMKCEERGGGVYS